MTEGQRGAIFVAPALLFILLVAFYPIIRNFWLSFLNIDLVSMGGTKYIGFKNYFKLIRDLRFIQSFENTIIFTAISVPIEFLLGLVFALTLNESFPGRRLVRAVAIIPWALPTAVMAMAWRWIFNDMYGVFGDILVKLGAIERSPAWLGEPGLAMFAAIFADVWKTTPFIFIILLAGLQSIPHEIYEAASIDGATSFRRFTRVTLPLLRPSIVSALMFRSIQAFAVFDLMWVLTGGGPGGSTQTISLLVYSTVFRYLDLGYGAALAVVAFVCVLALAGVISWFNKEKVEY
ncbi:MAG TPA: sugar ABC transporter permease [Firmicutes bacterium]|nr:sugar ABC transporter permease [Bacillota bacterium]